MRKGVGIQLQGRAGGRVDVTPRRVLFLELVR
ncbi:hypothetical protein C8E89_14019 [Mycolicibacterium moriokaense]|uniref:Uncharacterized protein n=1 Tax=Mycolicibacterium moriokaense TaxID=39691 RepID=A0A318H664_9MYCO|nr:hypothetical protein C8E89_14019 [Mycolicibacterium moriokaense]